MVSVTFDTLFGHRRKASKCKKLIGRVQCRLEFLKDRRTCIARRTRSDVASLISENQNPKLARARAKRLYCDLNLLSVYELLNEFCVLVSIHASCMIENKDIVPDVINEAVSSLVFASARCRDIPELGHVRKLFRELYGEGFTVAALELLPGNRVNDEIKERLSGKALPKDLVQELFDEIAGDCSSSNEPGVMGIESASQLQKQDDEERTWNRELVKEIPTHYDEIKCYGVQQSDLRDSEDESSRSGESDATTTSPVSSSIVAYDDYGEGYASSSSSDQFPEEKLIVYLDDIEIESTRNGVDLCEAVHDVFTFPECEDLDFVTMAQDKPKAAAWVHPKLPDYDDIKAKFVALKKATQKYGANHRYCSWEIVVN